VYRQPCQQCNAVAASSVSVPCEAVTCFLVCRHDNRPLHEQVLEDRFQGLVEGSLAGAFAKRRGEDVRQLVAMMVSIGRSGTVEKLYNAARLAPLQVCVYNEQTPQPVSRPRCKFPSHITVRHMVRAALDQVCAASYTRDSMLCVGSLPRALCATAGRDTAS